MEVVLYLGIWFAIALTLVFLATREAIDSDSNQWWTCLLIFMVLSFVLLLSVSFFEKEKLMKQCLIERQEYECYSMIYRGS